MDPEARLHVEVEPRMTEPEPGLDRVERRLRQLGFVDSSTHGMTTIEHYMHLDSGKLRRNSV